MPGLEDPKLSDDINNDSMPDIVKIFSRSFFLTIDKSGKNADHKESYQQN